MKFPKLGKALNIKVKTIKDTTSGVGSVVAVPHINMPKMTSAMSIHPTESLKEPDSERELRKFKNLQRYLKSST